MARGSNDEEDEEDGGDRHIEGFRRGTSKPGDGWHIRSMCFHHLEGLVGYEFRIQDEHTVPEVEEAILKKLWQSN